MPRLVKETSLFRKDLFKTEGDMDPPTAENKVVLAMRTEVLE